MQPRWRRGARGPVVVTTVVALALLAAAITVAVVLLSGGSAEKHHRGLSTTLASQQLAGLADPGPAAASPQRLLAPSGGGLAFVAGGGGASVLPSQQWQADEMSDGSLVLVYVPAGTCLTAKARSPAPARQLTLSMCDLSLSQRWSHPYLGKDPAGRDYWQLRSQASGRCVTASGIGWRAGTPAQLKPCGQSFGWQQLIEFWSAY